MHPRTPPQQYLLPGTFADSDNPAVIAFAGEVTAGRQDARDQAIALYYRIRDGFQYDPYRLDLRPSAMKASALLRRDYGYCIEKANLLAAAARVVGIPSRLGFANVRNHIGTRKLEAFLGTDLLVFHGYAELFLEGKWVKATPAFNRQLCQRLSVAPLEFDGEQDAVFQQYTADGTRFMDYVHDYGHFPDIPRDLFIAELRRHYPRLLESLPRGDDWYIIID